MIKNYLIGGLALLGLCLAPTVADGQTPRKERQTVYSLIINDGQTYVPTFARRDAKTIYLLAGADQVVSVAQTLVYYWPTTDEYLADWPSLRRPLAGRLLVRSNAGERLFTVQRYSLRLDALTETSQLLTGREAETAFQQYNRAADTYLEASERFSKLAADYERAYRDYLNHPAGTAPEPPAEPKPPAYRVTEPQAAFVLNLPAGEYQCTLVDERGRPVPDTAKTLIVFTRRRTGAGYEIIPERKWTASLSSMKPEEAIYVDQDSARFYLNAFQTLEYNEFQYDRLRHLQARASSGASGDRWVWVKGPPHPAGRLELLENGERVAGFGIEPFRVVQTGGTALGYTIRPFRTDPDFPQLTPNFSAYRIDFRFAPGARYEIRLVGADGAEIANSRRRIVIVCRGVANGWLIGLALAPFLAASGWSVARKKWVSKRV
jgi:hypothetical protein